ncbi:reverse transcriptase domain, reverse transcriptase zinc-binding domain protein [Tanacetum coccineum]
MRIRTSRNIEVEVGYVFFNVYAGGVEAGINGQKDIAWKGPIEEVARSQALEAEGLLSHLGIQVRANDIRLKETVGCSNITRRDGVVPVAWVGIQVVCAASIEERFNARSLPCPRHISARRKLYSGNMSSECIKFLTLAKTVRFAGRRIIAAVEQRQHIYMCTREKMEISRGCNASFVTIIPKVTDPIGLGDLRPISLIGCYYKIIAKILAERVKRVVGNVVGDVQNAFIKGRYILDGVLIANEAIEFLKKKREKCLIFKVDFEKAYDSINWNFLLNIMNRMGFRVKWCKWVEVCLRSSSMSILVNGSPTEEFGLERGVRQGDPLSPFLFILAAEGLNAVVKEAVESGIFRGVKLGANNVMVSHLQYVDDTIFFGEWNRENAKWRTWRRINCMEACGGEIQDRFIQIGSSRSDVVRWSGLTLVKSVLDGCGRYPNTGSSRSTNYQDWSRKRFYMRKVELKKRFGTSWCQKKVNIFVWRALRGRLSVREELDKRGIDLDSVLYPSCNNAVESCAHSLVTCDLAIFSPRLCAFKNAIFSVLLLSVCAAAWLCYNFFCDAAVCFVLLLLGCAAHIEDFVMCC